MPDSKPINSIKTEKMKKNVGTIDKVIRTLIAVTITILYSTNVITGVFGIVLAVLAVILMITSFMSFCPLYLLMGINTGRKR